MSTPKTERLRAKQIRIDGGTQMRAGIDPETVSEYAEHLFDLPPIIVYFDGVIYWLADGFHRFHAHRTAGEGEALIDCEVVTGTLDDAILYAAQANKTHGLRRTNQDKRNAVEATMKSKPDWSARKVSEHCGVSHTFINNLKKVSPTDVAQVETVSTSTIQDSSETHLSQDSDTPLTTNGELEFSSELPPDEQPAPDDDGSQLEEVRSAEPVKVRGKTRNAVADDSDPPFSEYNAALDGLISELRGMHQRAVKIIGIGKVQWSKALTAGGTTNYITQIIDNLRDCRPAVMDASNPKGYKTAREVEGLASLKKNNKAVAAGSAK